MIGPNTSGRVVAAVAAMLALGGIGTGVAAAVTSHGPAAVTSHGPTVPAHGTTAADTPEPGDTPDATADAPEPGDTPDAAASGRADTPRSGGTDTPEPGDVPDSAGAH